MDIRDVTTLDPEYKVVKRYPVPQVMRGPMASVDLLEKEFGPDAMGFRGVIGFSMCSYQPTKKHAGKLSTDGYVWFPNVQLPTPDEYRKVKNDFPDSINVLFFAFRFDHDDNTYFPQSLWDSFSGKWRAFAEEHEPDPDRLKEQKKLKDPAGVVLSGGPKAKHVVDIGVVINEMSDPSQSSWGNVPCGVKFMGLDRFVHFSKERHKDFDSVKDKLPPQAREIGELLQKLLETLPPDIKEEIERKTSKLRELEKNIESFDDDSTVDDDGDTVIPPDYFKKGKKTPPTTH